MLNDFCLLLTSISITSLICLIIYFKNKETINKRKEFLAIALLGGFMCFFAFFFIRYLLFIVGVALPGYMVLPITMLVFFLLFKSMSKELRVYEKTHNKSFKTAMQGMARTVNRSLCSPLPARLTQRYNQ